MLYKYLEVLDTNPYRNLSVERVLSTMIEKDSAILYLWQNDNTIVIGRNQDPRLECRCEEFVKNKGLIARRFSGGGCVYHDIGNLNYSLIVSKAVRQPISYSEFLVGVLNDLGFEAEYNGRNDIIVCEKKISGNAIYDDGNAICYHGTILINSNLNIMQEYLTPDRGKLNRNNVSSVSARVGNLVDYNSDITVDIIKNKMIDYLKAIPLDKPVDDELVSKIEKVLVSPEWIYEGKGNI